MAGQLDLIDPQKRLETFEKISSEGLLGVSKETIRGNEYYVFSESPDNLLGYYQLGLTHGEWTHVVFEDQQIPYSETLSRSYQLANSLQNIYGIEKGDKVAFSMRNYPEWMFAYMAVTSIGAVAVPLNSWWQGDELEYGLNNSESKLFIADQERLERLGNKCPDIKRISVRSENPDHSDIDFYKVIENQNKTLDNEVAVSPDDDASIMYTSGSTGHPKGVVSSHRSVMFAPFYWIALQTLLKESSDEENLGIMDEGDQAAVLVSVPLFHVTGSHAIFLLSIPVGRKTVLMHKWDPEVALDLIEREKISDFTGVPTMSYELVEAQKRTQEIYHL